MQIEFFCFDSGGKKRALMTAFTRHGAVTRWRRLPKISLRPFPQTKSVVEKAMRSALRKHRSPHLQRLKARLLGWQYNWVRRYLSRNPQKVACVWNGLKGERLVFAEAARDAGCQCLFFELGPLPQTVTIDPCGVNAGNALAREATPYLEWFTQSGHSPKSWRALGSQIKARTATAPPQDTGASRPAGKYLFVPLQSEGDSQLVQFGGAWRRISDFIGALVAAIDALPASYHLRLKHHPTAPERFHDLIPASLRDRIVFDDTTDTFTQVAGAQAVLTLNSSVGLESFFYDKPVIAMGEAFWNFAPLTRPAPDLPSLKQALSEVAGQTIDTEVTDAFMTYLTRAYYPKIGPGP